MIAAKVPSKDGRGLMLFNGVGPYREVVDSKLYALYLQREKTMQLKILWVVLIVTNLAWFAAFRIVDTGRANEIAQRQQAEQQRDACQSQVSKLTDTMSKLCTCGK